MGRAWQGCLGAEGASKDAGTCTGVIKASLGSAAPHSAGSGLLAGYSGSCVGSLAVTGPCLSAFALAGWESTTSGLTVDLLSSCPRARLARNTCN
jgi:hypothetical protein